MKKFYANIFPFNKKLLKKTILNLKKGNIVGLPTETVYGLAGNAYLKRSIKKIFKIKKRPKFNPLIVHYHNYKKAELDVIFNKDFFKLYNQLCPGPLTFVLKKRKKSKILPSVTANLNTVGIRFPNHFIIKKILKDIDFPIAMPSANLFSNVSPVNAYDVWGEFKHKLKIIINGGNSRIGLESTVIDLTKKPTILRPGAIEVKVIEKILKKKVYVASKKTKIKSPGMMKVHYSPGIPIYFSKNSIDKNCAIVTFGNKYISNKNSFNLSKKSDLKEAASNLYKILRKIKKNNYKKIFVVKIPNKGIGIAINDRLKRASKKYEIRSN
tara:strand:- start:735 stop:1709 length:975 start_codon:yes stop_codon:yes gene_type:complete